MNNQPSSIQSKCQCGAVHLEVAQAPLMRFYCHCLYCQEVYRRAYSDVTIVPGAQVKLLQHGKLDVKRYWSGLRRETCGHCGTPVMARMPFNLLGNITLLPGFNYVDSGILPMPKAHLFYHRRVEDVDDGVPKYNGFIRSELCAMRLMREARRT